MEDRSELYERAVKISSRKQFQGHSQNSLGWLIYGLSLYRAAQVLVDRAEAASRSHSEISLAIHLADSETAGNESRSSARPTTPQEHMLNLESMLSRYGYFLLARAVEVVLKGTLIEMDPDYFLVCRHGIQTFDVRRLGHNLDLLAEACHLELDENESNIAKSLLEALHSATYPIPLTGEHLRATEHARLVPPRSWFRLTCSNFAEAAGVFDRALSLLNQHRSNNGKSTWQNVFHDLPT